jgi:parallel beta-helix repeat protein
VYSNNNRGIRIQWDSDDNELFNNSIFSNKEDGIWVWEFSRNNIAHYNNIYNNLKFGMNVSYDSIVNATYNWWGDPTGPYHPENNSNGKGEIITNNIEFDPWLTFPAMQSGPVFNIDKNEYYEEIQVAIDDADPGNSIYVSSGTYYERVWIWKSINLIGEDKDTTLIDRMEGGDSVYIMDINWVNVTGFTISNSEASTNDRGVRINNADNVTISNNIISNHDSGIAITYSSSYINLIENVITSNFEDGIHMYSSNNNILDNEISFNGRSGINYDSNGPYSENNNISYNTVFSNPYGIGINRCNESIISNNIISSSSSYGFYMMDSTGNFIHQNNFINNTHQISKSGGSNNFWNNSNHEGNYWSDYNGIDDGSGDRPPGDGVGDTEIPHPFIDQGDGYYQLDNYPLMDPTTTIDQDSPQIISGPDVTNITHDSASIEWTTDEASDSTVRYGKTTIYGNLFYNSAYVTNHVIDLTNLEPSTVYHFMVESEDPYGNTVSSGDYTFSTDPLPPPVHNIDKDTYYDAIQDAIEDADSGNTILVSVGTYYENVIINTTINLIGEDRDNTIINGTDEGTAVYIGADWVNVSHFTLTSDITNMNSNGMGIGEARYCNITENNISRNFVGIASNSSESIRFSNNYLSDNGYGIIIGNSEALSFTENILERNGFHFLGDLIEHWNTHDFDTSNLANGKPVYYLKNRNSETVPANAGQIILANCYNIVIENQAINNTRVGIQLGFSWNNEIRTSTISNNTFGLYIYNSNDNIYRDNILLNNGFNIIGDPTGDIIQRNTISGGGFGIWTSGSTYNEVSSNEFSSLTFAMALYDVENWKIYNNNFHDNPNAIFIWSSNGNNISGNNISNNGMGIYAGISNSNNFTYNIFSHNQDGLSLSGVFDDQPENNMVFHNSFISNTNQSTDTSDNKNQWDNGYPSGGNYWDDYSGMDLYNGPNQDVFGSDGIGDSSYIIDSNSRDNYPLKKPYGEDVIPPEIELISPGNYDVIKPGTIIALDITDSNLDTVSYTLDDELYLELPPPYEIDTSSWEDGDWYIRIRAEDFADNVESALFNFVVDSVPPSISLESPEEGSYIGVSPEITLDITDDHLGEIYYSVNSQDKIRLFNPMIINGKDWPEGQIILKVEAYDQAWNLEEESFQFTKDITPPEITLSSPSNGSLLGEFATIKFIISDDHLDSVSHSVNEGSFIFIDEPYDLETDDWEDGEYKITFKAEDQASNIRERWFIFRKDTTPPSISSTSIDEGEEDVDTEAKIIIEFDESMDADSVEDAISISPDMDYACSWTNNNRTLTITCDELFEYDTIYTISINTKAKDTANLKIEDKFELQFTTESEPKKDDEFPILFLLLALLVVIIVVVLTLFLVMSRKKKAPVSGPDPDLFSGISQPPIQQYPAYQAQTPYQAQQPTVQISCPKCRYKFSVPKSQGPIRVQCPNCGTQGTLG